MGAWRWCGVVAALALLGPVRVCWADAAGDQDQPQLDSPGEHLIAPDGGNAEGFTYPYGDPMTLKAEEDAFPARHLAEGEAFTRPFLGPDLFPHLSAGTLLASAHERSNRSVLFVQRTDLDFYLLQIKLPTLMQDGNVRSIGYASADLLLPWKLDDLSRIGLLVGNSRGGAPS